MDNSFSNILNTFRRLDEAKQPSENRAHWDKVMRKGVVPSIDRERYTDLSHEGLEGPFRAKSGEILYYDPKAGRYYNRDSDMYVDYGLDESMPDTQGPGIDDSQSPIHGRAESKMSPLERKLRERYATFKKQIDEATLAIPGSPTWNATVQKAKASGETSSNLLYNMFQNVPKKHFQEFVNAVRSTEDIEEDGAIPPAGAAGTIPPAGATKLADPAQIALDANKIKQGIQGKMQLPPGSDPAKLSTALATAADTNTAKTPLAQPQAAAITSTVAPLLAKAAQDPALMGQLAPILKKAGGQ